MDDFNSDELALALATVYHQNKQKQQHADTNSHQKQSDDERRQKAYQNAETKFLARKVAEPCAVKEIRPFALTKEQEDLIIPEFIGSSYAGLPTDHTMAMEGKPYSVLIQMENGLVYMGVMSQVMHIHWPGGLQGELYRKMEGLCDGLIHFKGNTKSDRPIILADTRDYCAQLYPMHLNKDIRQHDFLGVYWDPKDDITNPKTKTTGLYYPAGGGSFQYLTDSIDGLFIDKIPPHILQVLGQLQKVYDKAKSENKIGKPIYARLDPDKPVAGRGWTIPIDPWAKREYFDIPARKYINPNRKKALQLIAKRESPQIVKSDKTNSQK